MALLSITLYRFMSVFGLTFILNRFRKERIPYKDQLVMSLSGLRGAIAFSLTTLVPPNLLPHIHQMLSTCIAIILFTSFIQGIKVLNNRNYNCFIGGSIGPLVEWLKIKGDPPSAKIDEDKYADDDENDAPLMQISGSDGVSDNQSSNFVNERTNM